MENQTAREQLAGAIETIARSRFDAYNAECVRQGKEPPYARFEDQPADLQESCRAQAADLLAKVDLLGYQAVPEGSAHDGELVERLSDEQVELLAREEHARWVDERVAAGWTLDTSLASADREGKRSPFLVPYDELTEDVKEYDRIAARDLIPTLASAGLAVVRG